MSVSCFSFPDAVGVPGRKSSLGENSVKSGCIRPEKISSNQDEFGRRESSRGESFVKTGCIRLEEIIPARKFCQIRMNSVSGNHPCEKVLSNQDAFGRRKSSLRENSVRSGCIWPAEIIPARKFCQIRMNSADGNHPCERIPSNQDAFRRRKSLELRECKENTGSLELRESVDILISVEL